jgi:hypothetical protein
VIVLFLVSLSSGLVYSRVLADAVFQNQSSQRDYLVVFDRPWVQVTVLVGICDKPVQVGIARAAGDHVRLHVAKANLQHLGFGLVTGDGAIWIFSGVVQRQVLPPLEQGVHQSGDTARQSIVVHDANARWLANHLGPELGEFGGIRCSAGIA